MTVDEVVAHLLKLPPDLPVWVMDAATMRRRPLCPTDIHHEYLGTTGIQRVMLELADDA